MWELLEVTSRQHTGRKVAEEKVKSRKVTGRKVKSRKLTSRKLTDEKVTDEKVKSPSSDPALLSQSHFHLPTKLPTTPPASLDKYLVHKASYRLQEMTQVPRTNKHQALHASCYIPSTMEREVAIMAQGTNSQWC